VDLSNILARIVDLACDLVRILDCDFIVELLADSNLDKTIVGSRILLQIWADRRICIPLFTTTPPRKQLQWSALAKAAEDFQKCMRNRKKRGRVFEGIENTLMGQHHSCILRQFSIPNLKYMDYAYHWKRELIPKNSLLHVSFHSNNTPYLSNILLPN
jgi:hypothetical protein